MHRTEPNQSGGQPSTHVWLSELGPWKWALLCFPLAFYLQKSDIVLAGAAAAVGLVPAVLLLYQLLISLTAHTNGTVAGMIATFACDYAKPAAAAPIPPAAFQMLLQSVAFNALLAWGVACGVAWYFGQTRLVPHAECIKSAKLWVAAGVVLSAALIADHGRLSPTVVRIANLITVGLPVVFLFNWWNGIYDEPVAHPTDDDEIRVGKESTMRAEADKYPLWFCIAGIFVISAITMFTWILHAHMTSALFPVLGAIPIVGQAPSNIPWVVICAMTARDGHGSLTFALSAFAGIFDPATVMALFISTGYMPAQSLISVPVAINTLVAAVLVLGCLGSVEGRNNLLTTAVVSIGFYGVFILV